MPASYHTPPVAVSAVFAGLLTKVGVYALIRSFTLLFLHDSAYTHGLILTIAGLTMITGVMGAIVQNDIRRILSFHIVSQIGYMVVGLGIFGLTTDPELRVLALAGAVFYIIHHIIVKTNLFFVSGIIYELQGSFDFKSLGGLYQSRPLVAFLFAVPAMSLVGIPPLSGFFAKLSVLRAGLAGEHYVIVAVALAASLLTMFSMTKIWAEVFWKEAPIPPADSPSPLRTVGQIKIAPQLWGPVLALAVVTIAIGIGAEFMFQLARTAAEQLAAPDDYIRVVLEAQS